jgi:hypothetical protein
MLGDGSDAQLTPLPCGSRRQPAAPGVPPAGSGRLRRRIPADALREIDVETGPPAPTYLGEVPTAGRWTVGRKDMKYMLLIYGDEELWGAFSEDDFAALIAGDAASQKGIRESGELVSVEARPLPDSSGVKM